jgi:hypothetical protein
MMDVMDMGNDSDWGDEVQDGLRQLPPREEGFLQSHAGGEAVLQAVMDGITLSYVHPFFPFFLCSFYPIKNGLTPVLARIEFRNMSKHGNSRFQLSQYNISNGKPWGDHVMTHRRSRKKCHGKLRPYLFQVCITSICQV